MVDPQRPFVTFVDVAAAPTSVCAATFDAAAAAVTTCAAFVIAAAAVCELPSTPAIGDVVNGTLTRAEIASPVPTFNSGDEAMTALLFINSTTYVPGSRSRKANAPNLSVVIVLTMVPARALRRRTVVPDIGVLTAVIALPSIVESTPDRVPGSSLAVADEFGVTFAGACAKARPPVNASEQMVIDSCRISGSSYSYRTVPHSR